MLGMRWCFFLLCFPLIWVQAENKRSANFAILPEADWQLGRRRTYLLGKTLSYRLNAYDDYSISELILAYIDNGEMPDRATAVGERAYRYIVDLRSNNPDSESIQLLLVRAYTMRWLNGYADLMWARFLEKLHIIRPRIVGVQYGDGEYERVDLFFWTFILESNIDPIVSFIETRLPFTISTERVADQILLVQHRNTEANLDSRERILGETLNGMPVNKKALFLRDIAESTRRPDSFLRGAARGQVGAGRWDSIFSGIIRRRLGATE